MSKCSVSVLVPVCNVERYLRQCLDSLISQTLDDIQIICLDDGSTDSSPSILEEYRRIDNRIEVVTKPNSGYGDSMNIGLERAKGEYVGIVESDDFAEPDMFEQLYTFAKKYDADAVKSNFYAHTENRNPKDDELVVNFGEGPFDTAFCPLEYQDVFIWRAAIWSGLYRTEFLRENDIRFLPTPGASFQDTSFHFKAFAAAERVALTERAFLHYRVDNVNSSVKSQKKVFCICDEYKEIWAFAKQHKLTDTSLIKKIPRIQFGGYKWNLDRLAPSLQHDFYKTFVKEFQEFSEKRLLDRGFFDENAWNDLSEMLVNPDAYYRKHYGPEEIEQTHILFLSDTTDKSIINFHSFMTSIGKSDEVYCFAKSSDVSIEDIIRTEREKDKRLVAADEILEGASLGLLSLDRIRGSKINLAFAEDGGTKPLTYEKERLEQLGIPIFLSLLANGFYHFVSDGPEAMSENSERIIDPSMPRTAKDLRTATAALESLARWTNNMTEGWPFTVKAKALDLMAPLWQASRQAYDSLSYAESIKAGPAPSSRLLDPAIDCRGTESPEAPCISVVIPVYNMDKYLSECLDSVLTQDLRSIEIICVDDGSTDSSLSLLERYATVDDRITVVHQINGGAGAARNRGMKLARGRYIAFIDPDDYYPDESVLSSLFDAAERSGKPLCGGSFSTVDPNGMVVDAFPETTPLHTIKREGYYSADLIQNDYCWIRLLYKRSFIEEHEIVFPEYRWYEDPVFLTRVLEAAGGYYCIPDVVYRYRVDYKPVEWTCEKTRDLLKGIAENLSYAARHRFNRLYTLLIHRLEFDYYEAIVDHLYDEEVFCRLMDIQASLNFELVNFVKEQRRGFHLIRPFVELKNIPDPVLDPAIVRLAKKTAASKPYRILQSARESIGV